MRNRWPTIAEVLHYAADHELPHNSRFYSCTAVDKAVERLCEARMHDMIYSTWAIKKSRLKNRIFTGLCTLGLDVSSLHAFSEVQGPPHVMQAYRYAWLKFCAMLAEEQGV